MADNASDFTIRDLKITSYNMPIIPNALGCDIILQINLAFGEPAASISPNRSSEITVYPIPAVLDIRIDNLKTFWHNSV